MTFFKILSAIFAALRIPGILVIEMLRFYVKGSPFRKYKNSLRQTLRMAIFRYALELDAEELGYLMFIKKSQLLRYAAIRHRKVIQKLPGYGKKYLNSFWVVKSENPKESDPVLIYLHGGGYLAQAQISQLESLLATYMLVKPEKRKHLSILLLDYKLASQGHPIPCQLNQLHETYLDLTKKQRRNHVILMGDSAGGNLALSFLQLLKREKDANTVFPKQLILVSPWCDMSAGESDIIPGTSYYENANRDMINVRKLLKNVPMIHGDENPNSLMISPALKGVDVESWNGIDTLDSDKNDICVIFGEDEALKDEIIRWIKNAFGVDLLASDIFSEKMEYIRANHPNCCNIRIFEERMGIHDAFFFFENHALNLAKNCSDEEPFRAANLDEGEFFGMRRVAEFLNDCLYKTT